MAGESRRELPNLRIVGGSPVPTSLSWMVSLQYYSSHYCGGALIHPEYVLTAGHCVDAMLRPTQVILNSTDWTKPAHISNVDAYILHPDFHLNDLSGSAFRLQNDIALLKLRDPLPAFKPIQLSRTRDQESAGHLLSFAGWGKVAEDGELSQVLQEVKVPVVDFNTCQQVYGDILQSDHICTGYSQGGKDACEGDSGGPLFHDAGQEAVQVGVVSFGNGCARAGTPGVSTRVADHIDWILSHVNLSEPPTQTPSRSPSPNGTINTLHPTLSPSDPILITSSPSTLHPTLSPSDPILITSSPSERPSRFPTVASPTTSDKQAIEPTASPFTLPHSSSQSSSSSLAVILGASIGSVAFISLLVVVAVFRRKSTQSSNPRGSRERVIQSEREIPRALTLT